MKQSQPLRVEYRKGEYSFVTRRFINSQLCYCNNPKLNDRVLGALGKYVDKYNITVYAFTLFGSHDHSLLHFEAGTKSRFFKDWGARTAEAVKKYVPDFGRGSVFEGRPDEPCVPEMNMLDRFFYIILQPIAAGLCKNISDYPAYNCFHDAINGKPKVVQFFRGSDYQKAKAKNPNVSPEKFIDTHTIHFKRIPGYEKLSQSDYRKFMLKEYEKRRNDLIKELESNEHIWPSVSRLKNTKCTERAINPKKSHRNSHRALILCTCPKYREEFLSWYFSIKLKHWEASRRYLRGDKDAKFPPGTIKPPGPYVSLIV